VLEVQTSIICKTELKIKIEFKTAKQKIEKEKEPEKIEDRLTWTEAHQAAQ
jgi:hypothetical protein